MSSLAPSPSLLASVAEDRFLRLHSTHAPPAQAGGQQAHKGEVLDRLYMQVKPTVVLWDGQPDVRGESGSSAADDVDSDGEGDDDGQLSGVLQGLMQSLMSKDILYEPMKDLGEKVSGAAQ